MKVSLDPPCKYALTIGSLATIRAMPLRAEECFSTLSRANCTTKRLLGLRLEGMLDLSEPVQSNPTKYDTIAKAFDEILSNLLPEDDWIETSVVRSFFFDSVYDCECIDLYAIGFLSVS